MHPISEIQHEKRNPMDITRLIYLVSSESKVPFTFGNAIAHASNHAQDKMEKARFVTEKLSGHCNIWHYSCDSLLLCLDPFNEKGCRDQNGRGHFNFVDQNLRLSPRWKQQKMKTCK
ncbi:hypothetical protein NPIL_296211 [Nephila pilipes]|uniref:Uncharacterized protein n=1 Tax=Nephila pilipes TaxID=299642 RepID=A0A8X6QLD7_NEPPI|nr:hypothetical protein NPIL_296211 [Nephila pilipes]